MKPLRGVTSLSDDKARGVTIVPDDMPDEVRSALVAEGLIVVSESEAANGPGDFDG